VVRVDLELVMVQAVVRVVVVLATQELAAQEQQIKVVQVVMVQLLNLLAVVAVVQELQELLAAQTLVLAEMELVPLSQVQQLLAAAVVAVVVRQQELELHWQEQVEMAGVEMVAEM
jgi:hypothetical protein